MFYSEKKAASSYILSARVDTRFGTQGKPIELVISLIFFFISEQYIFYISYGCSI